MHFAVISQAKIFQPTEMATTGLNNYFDQGKSTRNTSVACLELLETSLYSAKCFQLFVITLTFELSRFPRGLFWLKIQISVQILSAISLARFKPSRLLQHFAYIKRIFKGALLRRFCYIFVKIAQIFDKNLFSNMKLLLEHREGNIKGFIR